MATEKLSPGEKANIWISKNWDIIRPGLRVRVDHRYTSIVVSEINDGDYVLVIYKDWNQYKQCWDYHIQTKYLFLYNISLYRYMYKGKFGEGSVKKDA